MGDRDQLSPSEVSWWWMWWGLKTASYAASPGWQVVFCGLVGFRSSCREPCERAAHGTVVWGRRSLGPPGPATLGTWSFVPKQG